MRREELADLNAFLTVAEAQSFTRAAAQLGSSQSALSYTVRRLEARLGVRLLTRTTRKVAPTEAGDRLLRTLGQHSTRSAPSSIRFPSFGTSRPAPSASRPGSMPPRPSCGRRWSGCCLATPTSTSRSASIKA